MMENRTLKKKTRRSTNKQRMLPGNKEARRIETRTGAGCAIEEQAGWRPGNKNSTPGNPELGQSGSTKPSKSTIILCDFNCIQAYLTVWLKGQWRGALMFSLICAWINGWVNDRDGDLRRHRARYDVTVMHSLYCCSLFIPWAISQTTEEIIIQIL